MNDTNLWKRIFRDRFDYLVDSISINFNGDVHYLISAYVRAIQAYTKMIRTICHLINDMNKYIKSKHPNMSFEDRNIKKFLSNDPIRSYGFYINMKSFYIKDIFLFLNIFKQGFHVIDGSYTKISVENYTNIFKDYSQNIFSKSELVIMPEGWGYL